VEVAYKEWKSRKVRANPGCHRTGCDDAGEDGYAVCKELKGMTDRDIPSSADAVLSRDSTAIPIGRHGDRSG